MLFFFLICVTYHADHFPWFDCLNDIKWRVQIMKLFGTHFAPSYHHFPSLMPKYSPQRRVLKHSQPVMGDFAFQKLTGYSVGFLALANIARGLEGQVCSWPWSLDQRWSHDWTMVYYPIARSDMWLIKDGEDPFRWPGNQEYNSYNVGWNTGNPSTCTLHIT
jgi:hypothetical protein